eukprot:jgi/Hompol1/6666/HPOL_005049-RA
MRIEAFEDMVHRAITELRKIGLNEEGLQQSRAWTDIQFWKVVQMLSKFEEVPFDNLCAHPIFKGDATPLTQMERQGLVILNHVNGRPYSLRVGKPIYRTAFTQMAKDEKLAATMGILVAKQLISDEEKKIKQYEEEMDRLAALQHHQHQVVFSGPLWSKGVSTEVRSRFEFLAEKLGESARKIVAWSDQETAYKRLLKLSE